MRYFFYAKLGKFLLARTTVSVNCTSLAAVTTVTEIPLNGWLARLKTAVRKKPTYADQYPPSNLQQLDRTKT